MRRVSLMPTLLLVMVLAVLVLSSPHAESLGEHGQRVMDIVVDVLRQLMMVVVDFIKLVLGALVDAVMSLLRQLGLAGSPAA